MLALAASVALGAAPLEGPAAFGDWRADAPGVVRRISADRLPAPYATRSAASGPVVVERPAGARPKAPPGFTVRPYARLDGPRTIRTAPNGDLFVAETEAGRIQVLHPGPDADAPDATDVFAEGLDRPFGMAFYPPGPHPKWLYVALPNQVVRFAYADGARTAASPPEVVIGRLAPGAGGHYTRDIAVSPDGERLYISVGSASNVGEGMARKTAAEAAAWQGGHATGAAWGPEENRADVLVADPGGRRLSVLATGLRNCAGLAVRPGSGEVWCAVNERDLLGDDLPPDYVTRVKPGAFFGWPWYYTGDHEDPRLAGARPDLLGKARVPDVLIQPHSAPLGLAFYPDVPPAGGFPAAYAGDVFVALHGSWNRGRRTGYKIVRLRLRNGVPDGAYEDFVTGFVVDDRSVWGRPTGVAVAADGSLMFTDDAGDLVWRVSHAQN